MGDAGKASAERSRFVNRAKAKELLRTRREEIARELERLRSRLPRLEGNAERIREERDSH